MKYRHIVIAIAAALLSAAPAAYAQATPSVTIDNYAFAPAEITVPAGTTVTWTNAQGDDVHSSTSNDGLWDSGTLQTGESYKFTFQQPGDFAYACSIHPDMQGVVHVTN